MRSVIQQKQLRNKVGEILRRVEAGEEITVTVAGRPVAELSPLRRHRWVSGPALAKVWAGPAPQTLGEDLEHFPAHVIDPLAE